MMKATGQILRPVDLLELVELSEIEKVGERIDDDDYVLNLGDVVGCDGERRSKNKERYYSLNNILHGNAPGMLLSRSTAGLVVQRNLAGLTVGMAGCGFCSCTWIGATPRHIQSPSRNGQEPRLDKESRFFLRHLERRRSDCDHSRM